MATKWTSPTWRMPEESNQSKFSNYSLTGSGTVDISQPTVVGITSSYSWWMNRNSATSNTAYFYNVVGTAGYGMFFLNSSLIYLRYGGNYVILQSSELTDAILEINVWQNWTITRKEVSATAQDIKLYINGVKVVEVLNTTSVGTLGSSVKQVFGGSGVVKMLDFNVFDYILSESQINYLYNSGTPQNPMAIPGNAPVAYYPLGGSSTGSSSSLTIPNESVPSATVFDFNNTYGSANDFITSPNTLPSASDFTISLWANPSSTQLTYATTILFGNLPNGENIQIIARFGNGFFYVSNGSTAYISQSNAVQADVWTLITVTYNNSTGVLTAYLNGGENIYTSSSGTTLPTQAFGNLMYIGKGSIASTFFNGEISNVAIFNTALPATGTESVESLYNYGTPPNISSYSNLKAWYKMGVDTSNWNGSNWTIGNSTANYSSALNFGARNQLKRINIPLAAVNVTNAITVSSWIKTQKNNATRQAIITNYNSSLTANKAWGLQIGAAWSSGYTKANFFFYDDTASNIFSLDQSSSQVLTDNNWHHVVAVWDGTTTANAVKIFVDGLLAGQGTSTFAGPIKTALNSRPAIGEYARDVSGNYGGGNVFGGNTGEDGFMSNIQVWDTALTYGSISSIGDTATGQIAELFNGGTPLTTAIALSNMKSWYKLDNLTTGIQDSSSNSNNGTNLSTSQVSSLVSTLNGTSSGMTTANLVNSDLTRSIPYSSYSMNFDGDARIQLANATGLNFGTGDFTYSLWVNTADNGNNYFFGNSTDPSANNGTIAFGIHSANDPSWRIWVSGETIDGTLSVSDSWKHCVIRRTSGVINVFVDSVKDTSTGTLARGITNVGNIRIGTFGASEYINGEISNFAIWDSSLTENQIITIYNGGVPNDISSLSPTLWYSLGSDSYYNGSSFICPDLSTGSNDGTSTGMGSAALLGIGPGSTGNGTATGMNIPANLKGNAPNSTKNAFSINMTADDKTSSVPVISS